MCFQATLSFTQKCPHICLLYVRLHGCLIVEDHARRMQDWHIPLRKKTLPSKQNESNNFVPWVLQVYHLCFNFTTLQDSYPCFSIPQMRKQTQRVQVMCQGHTAKFESQDSMFPPWPSFLPHTLIAFPVARRVPLGNQCWFDEKSNVCRSLPTTYCWESLPAW